MRVILSNQVHELPLYSIVFYGDVKDAIAYMEKIEEKLKRRGFSFVKPFKITEVQYPKYKYLVFELRKDN